MNIIRFSEPESLVHNSPRAPGRKSGCSSISIGALPITRQMKAQLKFQWKTEYTFKMKLTEACDDTADN